MTGKMICEMGKEMFLAQTPPYVGDILWEHLDRLLRGKNKLILFIISVSNTIYIWRIYKHTHTHTFIEAPPTQT